MSDTTVSVPTFTELAGGNGVAILNFSATALADAGYTEREFAVSGEATSYRPVRELELDGHWDVEPDATAAFSTRIVVYTPPEDRFNGTVLVEWFNVSGGVEASPDLTYLGDEIIRGGYAYVGMSAQKLGVEGGEGLFGIGMDTPGLKNHDPVRYGSLQHPGDSFTYDMLSQVGVGLRKPIGDAPLGDLMPERVIAVGESQSAFRLVTYINAIQPLHHAFDGFFVHSRGVGAAGFGDQGFSSADVQQASEQAAEVTPAMKEFSTPRHVRTDGDAPVVVIQAEGDLGAPLNFAGARQPDSERLRIYEMAGTAHADTHLTGGLGDIFGCDGEVNAGSARFMLRAALRRLVDWVAGGPPPPSASPVEMADGEIVRDADRIALGGIRTPSVDVPYATLSGVPRSGPPICMLFGSTDRFAPEEMQRRYGSREAFLERYRASADKAIAEGWLLADDLDAVMADAEGAAFPA